MFDLFTSHFLSTWNSRLFEMGAVLYIAAIYTGTLLPVSVYLLVRSGIAILLSPALGSLIDECHRLRIIRISIIAQRAAVATSCGTFWILYSMENLEPNLKTALFSITVLLACIEKLSSITNSVAIERDWVVVISGDDDSGRRAMNARMRRIDLFCKLVGPLTISLIDGASTTAAIAFTLTLNIMSVPVEYFAIARVFKKVPELHRARTVDPVVIAADMMHSASPMTTMTSPVVRCSFLTISPAWQSSFDQISPAKAIKAFVRHGAFLPSVSLSLLYLTVLSFSGQMITYLVTIGYTSSSVGIARAISTVFELSATWIAPFFQRKVGTIRGGIWSLTWQMVWLAIGLSWFLAQGNKEGDSLFVASTGLVGAVILSRMGLWSFDLCAQSLIQEEVDEHERGVFSTVEVSLQNLCEMLSYLTTIIFQKPNQFRWPVFVSVATTFAATGIYTYFVRRRRGHLIHMPNFAKL